MPDTDNRSLPEMQTQMIDREHQTDAEREEAWPLDEWLDRLAAEAGPPPF